MKNILHIQIPTNEEGRMIVDVQQVDGFVKHLKKSLPKYYLVYASPFKVTINKNNITIDSTNVKNLKRDEFKWLKLMKDKVEKEDYIVTLIR